MALAKRYITATFQLGQGTFGEDGSDTIEVKGLRISATIAKAGGVSLAELNLRVFGMSLDVMNKLSILGKPIQDGRFNKVTISAGDENSGLAVVFSGIINEAWVDSRNMPQIAFIVVAHTGGLLALQPVPPTSYKGSLDAALVVSGIAQQAGLAFQNSGVTVQISDPYLSGTFLTQLQDIARHGNFNCVIEGGTPDTIAIWPVGTARGGGIPLLSPDTGLVGYPLRTQNGISLQCLFNPSIVFYGLVQVQSDITPANGQWKAFSITHDLECETVNGKWFTSLECSLLGQEPGIA